MEFSMDDMSEEDKWFAGSEEIARQFSKAIALVLRDADAVLGEGVITHDIDDDEEAFLG